MFLLDDLRGFISDLGSGEREKKSSENDQLIFRAFFFNFQSFFFNYQSFFFAVNISRKKNSKTSKVNQQSLF